MTRISSFVLLLFIAGCHSCEPVRSDTTDASVSTSDIEVEPVALAEPEPVEAMVEPAENPPADELPSRELPDLVPIQKDVERIRGLDFKQDVPAAIQSIEEFGNMVDAELERGFPVETRDGVMAALVRLGILEEPIDLGEGMKNALLSQAAAYYDPTTDRFYYLMADLPKEMLDVTAAHELVHALQDQHFDLDALVQEMESAAFDDVRNDDRILALRFLVEGEATYVMTHWQMKAQMGMDLSQVPPAMEEMSFSTMANMSVGQLVAMSSQQAAFLEEGSPMREAAESMKSIPPYLLGPLFQAYMGGAFFTMKVKHKDGWEGISKVYGDLPTSSEQTLHPEKYLEERDFPSRITFPELRALQGWKRVDAAVHGEYYIRLLLDQAGHQSSKKVAAGWDGDLYHGYQGPSGQLVVVFATTWDSEAEAMEFFGAWRDTRKNRFPGYGEAGRSSTDVLHVYGCGGELGTGRLLRRGKEVFVVEGGSPKLCELLVDELQAIEIDRK